MADRPITFSPAMVRALLAGTKTQTRRFLDAWCDEPPAFVEDGIVTAFDESYRPYRWPNTKAVGDRLYVREHWRTVPGIDDMAPRDMIPHLMPIRYEADEGRTSIIDTLRASGRFRQAMHMPKWASRITLHVTEVRVQRLMDISDADAMAEGIDMSSPIAGIEVDIDGDWWPGAARRRYGKLWNTINGTKAQPDPWSLNPWVTATTFEVELCHIDQARAA